MQMEYRLTTAGAEQLDEDARGLVEWFNQLKPEQQMHVKTYIWRQGQANEAADALKSDMALGCPA